MNGAEGSALGGSSETVDGGDADEAEDDGSEFHVCVGGRRLLLLLLGGSFVARVVKLLVMLVLVLSWRDARGSSYVFGSLREIGRC